MGRFTRLEIEELIHIWGIPSIVRGKNKIIVPVLDAIYMLLTHLHYSMQLVNIYNQYGWNSEWVSYIVQALLEYIVSK